MDKRMLLRILLSGLLLVFLSGGCLYNHPYLTPIERQDESAIAKSITIAVRPVVTNGLFSQDRKIYEIDLSSYFTTFNIHIINNTDRPIIFDYNDIYLIDNKGKKYHSLDREEAINYYRYGDRDPENSRVILPKPITIIRREMKKIEDLIINSETISPSLETDGLIFFKRLSDKDCSDVTLKINGVRIEGEDKNRRFHFKFSCA